MNNEKNLGKALLALSMVAFLGACSGGMEDTELKDSRYYMAHKEEAYKKAEWCIKKFNIDEFIKTASKDELMKIASDKEMIKSSKLDEINTQNCFKAIYLYKFHFPETK